MKRSSNLYFSIAASIWLIFTLSSCEREIILDYGGYTPKIVMNGIISPDSLIEIWVSKSFLYTDTVLEKSLLKDATLTLFINGVARDRLQMMAIDTIHDYDWRNNYTVHRSLYCSTIRPKAGDKIRIEASAEGFNDAWVETIIPIPPHINRIDTSTFLTSKKIVNDGYGEQPNFDYSQLYPAHISVEEQYRNLRIKMAITAGTDATQYFQLRVRQTAAQNDPKYGPREEYFFLYTDDDPIFEENYQHNILEDLIIDGIDIDGRKHFTSMLFSNKLFRNNQYTLDFSLTGYYYIHTTYEERETEDASGWIGDYYPRITYVPIHTEVLNPPLEVQFTLITPELYPYYRKFNEDPYRDENPLEMISEPVITVSNVHNGIGIVGAISTAKAQIEIPPFPGGENRVPRRF